MTLARARPIVMLVTNRARLAERVGAARHDLERVLPHLLSQIESAAGAGVSLIQLREPDLDARTLTRIARAAAQVVKGSPAKLLVNGRLDVALASGAGGLHLPERGLPVERVRTLLPQPAVVGASLHQPAGLDPRTTDYAVFGTVFPTTSKAPGHPVAGIEGLRQAVEASVVPVLAIGGVTLERIPAIVAAGAAGFAAIELFLPAAATSSVTNLRKILESVHEAFDTVNDVS